MRKLLNLPVLILFFAVLLFFKPVFFEGKLPIPADTIIGLYHPFRDLYAADYPNGIPYKNFLITDPVRQQYPWRFLVIEQEKRGELPLWNPYSMAGTPLAASLQSAAFYPLNFSFFVMPFPMAWSLLIMLQPLLAGCFLYLYLKNLKLSPFAAFLGSVVFAFCGFSIAWLEWGTLIHIVLWLPLILLAIDKIFSQIHSKENAKFNYKKAKFWPLIFVFSLSASLLAGHFQFFFYAFLIVLFYFFAKWWQQGRSYNFLLLFLLLFLCFIILTFIQWWPTLQFISQSARELDQVNWHIEGWFIPWQHLIQFIAPDFFGNPTTLNYWGVWNYGELVGYIGIAPLLFALYALFFRRDKKTLFFGTVFFLSLIFSLPTIFAKLPFLLDIPFLSTSQPTRLLFLIDFALAILAALGVDWYIKTKKKREIIFPLFFLSFVFAGLWLFVLLGTGEHLLTAKHNLYLPTAFFVTLCVITVGSIFLTHKKIQLGILCFILIISMADLLRFAYKFTPFTNSEYLFPSTKTLSFLQNDKDQFRIMTTDSRILPPNFSVFYHIQSVDGYDPLYLRSYGELIAASERGRPDISGPFGFNRIITPQNINSPIINLLGVKYILSFSELPSPKFEKVFEEGQTKIYRNIESFPRTFFVANLKVVDTKQKAINALFDKNIDLRNTAVVYREVGYSSFAQGKTNIVDYSENKIEVEVENTSIGFLVLTDTYYPTWKVKICSKTQLDCKEEPIILTDYNFRGIVVPAGKHSIVFYNTLL
jgi:hypothetical protein